MKVVEADYPLLICPRKLELRSRFAGLKQGPNLGVHHSEFLRLSARGIIIAGLDYTAALVGEWSILVV